MAKPTNMTTKKMSCEDEKLAQKLHAGRAKAHGSTISELNKGIEK